MGGRDHRDASVSPVGWLMRRESQMETGTLIFFHFSIFRFWVSWGISRFETARPVALPLGSLIALGLKCLSLTPETQVSLRSFRASSSFAKS